MRRSPTIRESLGAALRAATYARYSTTEQDAQSIDDQLARCAVYAERKGHRVVETFSDAAVSGTHTDRAGLQALLTRARERARGFDVVLVDDLSRLSRSMSDFWPLVDELHALGLRFVDVMTGVRSDDPNARLLFGVKILIADQMVETVRWQTRRGLAARARDGFSAGGTRYGFTTMAEPNPRDAEHPRKLWTIHEPEAAIVRRMFDLRIVGHGLYAIAAILDADGVVPPRSRRDARQHWSAMTIRGILTNPMYMGELVFGRKECRRVGRKIVRTERAPEEVINVSRPELAIIDRATFGRVQSLIEQRGRGARAGSTIYTLTGICRCGVCSGPIGFRSSMRERRYVYFGCLLRREHQCTMSRTFEHRAMVTALVRALRELLADPAARAAYECGFKRGAAIPVGDRAGLEAQLAKAKQRATNATRLLVEDPDDADLRAARNEAKRVVARIERELAEVADAPTSMPPSSEVIARSANALADLIERDPAGARDVLVRQLGPLVVSLTDAGRLRVTTVFSPLCETKVRVPCPSTRRP
ncbi:MAG TPA: recombinase family protein [Kofleriaceae bacterium]